MALPAPGRRWRRSAVALLSGLALLAGPGARAQVDRLPDLGAASGDELSGAAERRLGESIMRELRTEGVVWDDALGAQLAHDGFAEPAFGGARELIAARGAGKAMPAEDARGRT